MFCSTTLLPCGQENITGTITECINCDIIKGSAGGSAEGDPVLEVTAQGCGPITIKVRYEFDWDQGPGINWIHGVSFDAGPLWSAFSEIPPPDWIFIDGGLTGLCSGTSYGDGYFYDSPIIEDSSFNGSECEEISFFGGIYDEPNNGDPSDNWGVNCTTNCPFFEFELTYCPTNTFPQTFVEQLGFTVSEDGASGGWYIDGGCELTNFFDVTINQTCGPNAGFMAPPDNFCNSSNFNLLNLTAGFDAGAEWSGSNVIGDGNTLAQFDYCDNINNTTIEHEVGENGCYDGPISHDYVVWTPQIMNVTAGVTEGCGQFNPMLSYDVIVEQTGDDWFDAGGTGTLAWSVSDGSTYVSGDPLSLLGDPCSPSTLTFTPMFMTGCGDCDVTGPPIDIMLIPEFTENLVSPSTCGDAYVEILGSDGSVCQTLALVSCPNNGDIDSENYDETFNPGTACEVTFTGTTECSCILCDAEAGDIANPSVVCPGENTSIDANGYNADNPYENLILVVDSNGDIIDVGPTPYDWTVPSCDEFTFYSFNYDTTDGNVTIPTVGDNVSGIDCDTPCCDLSDPGTIDFTETVPPTINLPSAPTVSCYQDFLDNVPSIPDATWSDNCPGGGSIPGNEISNDANNCDGGTIVWEYTVTDDCGNPATDQVTISIPPLDPASWDSTPDANIDINCGDPIPAEPTLTYSNGAGAPCEFSGNGPAPTLSGDNPPVNCGDVLVRTWSGVTDDCGNPLPDVVQTITILDDIEPTFDSTPSPIGDIACGDPLPPQETLTASDNCGNATVDPTEDVNIDPCGGSPITYTWTATDECSNSTSTMVSFQVLPDTEAPTIDPGSIADITLTCTDDIPPSETLMANDNCDPAFPMDISADETESGNGCTEEKIITRTWIAEDVCGNQSPPFVQTITILADMDPPVIDDPSPIPSIGCSDDLPDQEDLSATDDCTTDVQVDASVDPFVEDICNGYQITYRWTAMDDCGKTADKTVTFDVLPDQEAPVFDSDPSNIPDLECDETPPGPESLTASDDCDDDVDIDVQEMPEPEDLCNGYSISYVWTATDECNNSTSTSAVVNILPDSDPPVLDIPSNNFTQCDNIPPVGIATADDNCDINPTVNFLGEVNNEGSGCPYTIERSWQAEDACGNVSDIQTQIITVNDNDPPEILNIPGDETFDCFLDVNATIPDLSWIDNCSAGGTVIGTEDPPLSSIDCNGGEVTRTWEVTDDCDNTTTEIQIITILPTPPVDWISSLPNDMDLNCGDPAPIFQDLEYDNGLFGPCRNNGFVAPLDDGADLLVCGDERVYTWTLPEDLSNCINELTYSITVTVVDDELPSFVSVPGDANYNCFVDVPPLQDLQWEDNCAPGGLVSPVEDGSFTDCDGGTITRTWDVSDGCDNFVTHVQMITVDPIPPIDWTSSLPNDITIDCGTAPPPFLDLNYSNFAANAACLQEGTISPSESGSLDNPGDELTLTWEYTSDCDVSISHVQTITVGPIDPPNFTGSTSFCPNSFTTIGTADPWASYEWSTTETTQFINVSAEATYSLTVTDNLGCTAESSIDVNEENELFPIIDGSEIFCNFDGNSATLDVGTGFDSYDWSDGSTSSSIEISGGDTYQVTVFDASGCSGSSSITVVEYSAVQVEIMGATTVCENSTVALDAGFGFDDYEWSNGANTQDNIIQFDGIYSVTVFDENGCSSSDEIEVFFAAGLSPEIVTIGEFCQGSSVELETQNVFTQYEWSNGATDDNITVTDPAQYSVTVTDENGCTGESSIEIQELGALDVDINGSTSFCDNGNTTLDAGTWDAYEWSNGETTQSIVVDTEDDFSVTVTDDAGCQGESSVSVSIQSSLEPTIGGDLAICQGSTTELNAGSGFDSYSWSDGSSQSTLVVSIAGTYSVTVSDASGCSGESSVEVTEVTANTAMISGTFGFCDGGSTTIMVDGTWDTYAWSNGANSASITIVDTDTYSVTVTDGNGCTATTSQEVIEQTAFQPEITGAVDFCDGDDIMLGTTETYSQFEWSSGESANTITVNSAGLYELTVTDDFGCTGTSAVTVNTLNANQVMIGGSNTYCIGSSTILDGDANNTSWMWSTSETTQTITVNSEGDYSVTVTDANGCISSSSIQVTEEATLSINILGIPEICPDGSSTLSAGTFETYAWDGPEGTFNTPTVDVSAPGTYSVTVTDAGGCVGSGTFDLSLTGNPEPEIIGLATICAGTSTELTLSDTYNTYTWSTNEQTPSITATETNTYSVTVTDGSGCTGETSFQITVQDAPVPTIVGPDQICPDGMEMLSADAVYDSYTWSTGDNTQEITIIASGLYELTVSDAAGCTGTSAINVTNFIVDQALIGGSTAYCAGTSTTLNAGDQNMAWIWSTGETTSSIDVNTEDNYAVTVTDMNGCTSSSNVDVTEEDSLSPNITGDLNFCNGDTGVLDAGLFESWQWDGPGGPYANEQMITITESGTYTVTVMDSGCEGEGSVDVTLFDLPDPQVIGPANICPEDNQELTLSEAFSSYEWSTGDQTPTTSISMGGMYTVTVLDDNGCSSETFIDVIQSTVPTLQVNSTPCSVDATTYDIIFTTDVDITGISGNINATDNLDGTFTIMAIDTSMSYLINLIDADTGCDTTYLVDPPNCGCGAIADIGPGGLLTCDVDQVTLGGPNISVGADFTTQWFDEDGTELSSDPNYTATETGIYTLLVTDLALDCTDSASFELLANQDEPLANILVDPSNIIDCTVESVTLSVDGGLQNGIVYSWTIDGYLIAENEESITIFNSGEATLTALDTITLCGSSDVENITDGEDFPGVSFAPADELNCSNNTVVLDASSSVNGGQIQHQWLDENQVPIDGATDLTLTVTEAGTYYFQNSDPLSGCIVTEEIVVTEDFLSPTVDAGTEMFLPCDGTGVSLNGTSPDDGNPDVVFNWNNNSGAVNNDASALSPIVDQPGWYIVEALNIMNGCNEIDSVLVSLQGDQPYGFNANAIVPPCGNFTDGMVNVAGTIGGIPPFSYSLNGTTSQDGIFDNLSPGSYELLVEDSNGCIHDTTFVFDPGTIVSLNANPSVINLAFGETQDVELTTNLDDAEIMSFEWSSSDDVSCTDCLNPVLSPVTSQNYIVTLTDINGCSDTTQIRVIIENIIDIFIPTIINPDGPLDVTNFTMFADENIVLIDEFFIYDRWGELVFYTEGIPPNDPLLGWDGTFQGQAALNGVYVYLIKYSTITGDQDFEAGDVTLAR